MRMVCLYFHILFTLLTIIYIWIDCIWNGTTTTSQRAHHHHHHQWQANSQQQPATTAQWPHRVTTSPHHCQQPLHGTVQRAHHHGTTTMAMTTVTAHSRGFFISFIILLGEGYTLATGTSASLDVWIAAARLLSQPCTVLDSLSCAVLWIFSLLPFIFWPS